MDDRQYKDLFETILDLRGATEIGFTHVYRRFDEVGRRFDRIEERWNRRFGSLEDRVEDGFRDVCASLAEIGSRLSAVERR